MNQPVLSDILPIVRDAGSIMLRRDIYIYRERFISYRSINIFMTI